jgi:hypothetical protein
MPVYQVTLTYLITVDSPIDAEDAIQAAANVVEEHPNIYSDVYVEKVED